MRRGFVLMMMMMKLLMLFMMMMMMMMMMFFFLSNPKLSINSYDCSNHPSLLLHVEAARPFNPNNTYFASPPIATVHIDYICADQC